jgi:hypothetical protein
MAELKVDKILPATGSSIALGESGKTVTIPSGATLDASAATLTNIGAKIDYCSSVKTSPFTASASRGYFINTGSAVTVTLPSSPNVGDQIIVIDATGNASSNNITLGRGGSKIKGICNDATLITDRVGVRIVYSGSSQGWVTATSVNETAPVLTQNLYVTATGGNTVATCGNYKIHTFTADGNFVVSCAGNSGGNNKIDYMVVAGGGGGGAGGGGGGGGAGGFRESRNPDNAPAWTASPLASTTSLTLTAATFPVTIGAGGAGGSAPTPGPAKCGSNGNNSVFSTITSTAGGGGGQAGDAQPLAPGNPGGSGGGSGQNSPPASNSAGSGNTPPVRQYIR